ATRARSHSHAVLCSHSPVAAGRLSRLAGDRGPSASRMMRIRMTRLACASMPLVVLMAIACSTGTKAGAAGSPSAEPQSCRCSVVTKDGEEYFFGCGADACYSEGDKLFGVHCDFGGLTDNPSACNGVLPDGGDA